MTTERVSPNAPRAVRCAQRLADERGIVLPIALAVMTIALVLGGAAVLAATIGNNASNLDAGSKAALEAAEAGLRAATYRLNMFLPQQGYCPTNPVSAVGGSALCAQDGPESIGNGESFSYWVSNVLASGQQCAGVPVTASSGLNPQTISQRCITALGTANTGAPGAVSAHLQVRVASYSAEALFSVPGLIGLNRVTLTNNSVVHGETGTNGTATLSNNSSSNGVVLGPNGAVSTVNNSSSGTVIKQTAAQGPLGLPLPNFGNSATVNSDARIGAANSSTVTCRSNPPGGSTVDTCNPFVTWHDTAADPRDLSLTNNATLTLGGGVYNFCNFAATNNVTIKIAAGTYTTIYIDSPNDPNSAGDTGTKCAAGSGNLTLANNISVNVQTTDPQNPGVTDPTALKIFVYGNPSNPGSNVISWTNNGTTAATLVAPFSTVNLPNNANWTGAIGAYDVEAPNNFTFNWYGKESSLVTGQQDLYYRTAWEQCPALGFSTSAPTAGC